jgi:endonuclease/exonuclease/phosphatase family metal-dependent hydrolase
MAKILRYAIFPLFILFIAMISYDYFSKKEFSIIRDYTLYENTDHLKIMTYNIRMAHLDTDMNKWDNRKNKLVNLIKKYSPDIVGTQEGTITQLQELEIYFPEYKFIGYIKDKDPGNSENMIIFYKPEKFEVIEYETAWISDTPNIPFSKSWDSMYPRSGTFAHFRNKNNNLLNQNLKEFAIVNVHLDHKGKTARVKGSETLINYIANLKIKDLPIFLLGDFNESPGQRAHQLFLKNGYLDVWTQCKEDSKCTIGENFVSSFHYYYGKIVNLILSRLALYAIYTFHGSALPEFGRYHIDWILFKNAYNKLNPVLIEMPAIDIDNTGIYASDHFPIIAVFSLENK